MEKVKYISGKYTFKFTDISPESFRQLKKFNDIYFKNKVKNRKVKTKKIEVITGLSYLEFLKTKYWSKVKRQVLKRDNYKCQKCGSGKLLHVHHLTYKHHLKEHCHLSDLITLCKQCHEQEPGHKPF